MISGLLSQYHSGYNDAVWAAIADLNISELNEMEQTEVGTVISDAISVAKRNIRMIIQEIQKQPTYSLKVDEGISKFDAIDDLIELVKPFGFLPLTFLEFYKTMPGVNLIMDDRFQMEYPYSDPLYIDTVENILDVCSDGSWEELMEENEDEGLPVYLYISPDNYHKDNVSGGEAYGIEISKVQKVDGRVFNTPYGELSLIQYLNTCFRSAGFLGIKKNNPFIDVVPQLNII